ncbi:MAG: T9SS type A sorting domain-containing protein [Ginsengibacter sp.]
MKKIFLPFCLLLLTWFQSEAQTATVSYPFAIGYTSNCGSGGTAEMHYYTYNGTTNVIKDASGGLVGPGTPQLRIGSYNAGAQVYTSIYASVSFNPKDHNIYYFWTATSGVLAPGGIARTYAWRWPAGTIPTGTSPRLDTLRSFKADILGVAFDNNGTGYDIEFSGALPTSPLTYKPLIRSMNFVSGTFGGADTLNLTGGAKVYQQGSGDVAMSPSGQMFFVVDNKLFTPNYLSYTGTGANLTCTYIDTVKTSGNFVGLTYAEGEAIAAFSGGVCPFQEINLLTAANNPITKFGGSVKSAWDMATIVSGIGAAKKLVSVTPTGTPGQYNVAYDVYIQNYGNMDIKNVQVNDDLRNINGAANVTGVSAFFMSNPAGLTLDPTFNGKTNRNLLNGTGTLPNYPTANNNCTIRILCTLSNIVSGVVYYNSAIATAVDFNSNNLSDSSTNGSNPDLNSNDKPDDLGEGQPTPLLISVTPQTPPCTSLTNILYTQDFGTGTGLVTAIPAPVAGGGAFFLTGTSNYTPINTAPIPVETYTISNNANNANNANFISLTDHTGNTNGRMLIVNADAANTIMYQGSFIRPLCANQQYSLSFYAAFLGNANYQTVCNGFGGFKYSQVKIQIIDNFSGLIITEVSTSLINNGAWQQYGLKFVSPASYTSISFRLINDAPGGCGNDIALDDIQFGSCDPLPVVSITAITGGCIGSSTTFTASLSDPNAIPGGKDFQWQIASALAGPYTNITGATSATYTINPITGTDVGKYYRVIIAATGNIGNTNCQYISPGFLLTAKAVSVAATSAKTSILNICPGKTVTLSVVGGTLGANASWKWYTSSCGGTLVGTGATINVTPFVVTTYYVRAEGDCNITSCVPVTVYISCDIDKDKDGIPDYVESNMPLALQDADGDGIINAFDTDYPGYVDNNGDFVNDNFQADGDSDGDGIPNYLDTDFPGRIDVNGDGVDDRFDSDLDGIINMLDLDSDNDGIPDVVEAGGVDQNGDGKLDNFVDTDGDGLSDQVDANLSGAYNSGLGLGLKDTDGDGIANEFDLDSDADGIPDVREVGGADVNNDGRIDGFIDANHDGISDNILFANALLRTGPDTNNDGRADSYPYKNMDRDKVPNPYDIDSDGDGIVDALEAGFADANFDGRADGTIGPNGWVTSVSSLPTLVLPNSDSDPNPNYLDIDSDNDGIPDNIEGPSTFDYLLPSGLDTDGDGLDNSYDDKPTVWGGHGVFLIDTDADGIPDYLDLDTDGDGSPDISEGNDFNFNGIADDLVTLMHTDADGDGLDDRFDMDNTSTKGTSAYLGNYGSFSGDPSPGTRSVVQQTPPMAGNRDWRWIPYVLPVRLISFTGINLNLGANMLEWTMQSPEEIGRFEIWRSTDHIHFTRVSVLSSKVQLNQPQQFSIKDDITQLSGPMVFYRLHIFGKKGDQFISNIILIKSPEKQLMASLVPNPATNSTIINMQSILEGSATIKLVDNTGKVVEFFTQNLLKGSNQIPLTHLDKYSNGVYSVQILIKDELINLKLVILK